MLESCNLALGSLASIASSLAPSRLHPQMFHHLVSRLVGLLIVNWSVEGGGRSCRSWCETNRASFSFCPFLSLLKSTTSLSPDSFWLSFSPSLSSTNEMTKAKQRKKMPSRKTRNEGATNLPNPLPNDDTKDELGNDDDDGGGDQNHRLSPCYSFSLTLHFFSFALSSCGCKRSPNRDGAVTLRDPPPPPPSSCGNELLLPKKWTSMASQSVVCV